MKVRAIARAKLGQGWVVGEGRSGRDLPKYAPLAPFPGCSRLVLDGRKP